MSERTSALAAVAAELGRQDEKWGLGRDYPDGTGPHVWATASGLDASERRDLVRDVCDADHHAGRGTWSQILEEEHAEALAESDPAALRAELIQVAAVALQWVEAIDRRSPF